MALCWSNIVFNTNICRPENYASCVQNNHMMSANMGALETLEEAVATHPLLYAENNVTIYYARGECS